MKKFMVAAGLFTLSLIMSSMLHAVKPLNNPVYGSMCSASGVKPEGRMTMGNIMCSVIPEGRIFAIQGLFVKNIKSLKSKNRYSGTIDKILKLVVPVNVCMGCQFDSLELDAEELYREVNGNLSPQEFSPNHGACSGSRPE